MFQLSLTDDVVRTMVLPTLKEKQRAPKYLAPLEALCPLDSLLSTCATLEMRLPPSRDMAVTQEHKRKILSLPELVPQHASTAVVPALHERFALEEIRTSVWEEDIIFQDTEFSGVSTPD